MKREVNQMKKIYILLMHTNTVPSKLIRFFTNYQFSHVGISLEPDCNLIYSFGRKTLHSILNCGFTIESKNGEFFTSFNKTICKIYEVEVTERQYNQVKDIFYYMNQNKEIYKYDFLGIILRYFKIPIQIKNKYVCSYFVASVLEQANIYQFQKKTCMVVPKDFEKIPTFREIYDGIYNTYKI